MGIFRSESKEAVRDWENKLDHLDEVSRRDKAETDAYLAANREVAEAEKKVSWFRR